MCHFHFVHSLISCVLGKERMCIKNLYVFNLFYANHILHNYCCVLQKKKETEKDTEQDWKKNCVCDLYS